MSDQSLGGKKERRMREGWGWEPCRLASVQEDLKVDTLGYNVWCSN